MERTILPHNTLAQLTLKVPPTHRPPAGRSHSPTIKANYQQRINSHESAAGESVVGDDVTACARLQTYLVTTRTLLGPITL